MPFLNSEERTTARAIADLAHANPFQRERVDAERQILGPDFRGQEAAWHRRPESTGRRTNVDLIARRVETLVEALHARLREGARPSEDEARLYEEVVAYHLFQQVDRELGEVIERGSSVATPARAWGPFRDNFARLHDAPGLTDTAPPNGDDPVRDPAHLFACFFQLRRAFHYIFSLFVGASAPAIDLRARVWQSIFTHDMRRYRRSLYRRMGDVTTLITGPSGSGKELVARAIGLARYIPFDEDRRTFRAEWEQGFQALNLSALSPTLIESELFGHCRGAFTGAVRDRAGWLETCPDHGAVFLDEIGDLDESIQVKLLRVIEDRTFQRLGETKPRTFRGKILAATNRDLARDMFEGRFRRDFYYRLCSDLLETPSLRSRIEDRPAELDDLVAFLAARNAGAAEAADLAREVLQFIEKDLGRDHAWPGNVRELDQCVRNVLVQGEYAPPRGLSRDPIARLTEDVAGARLDAGELLSRYATLVYARVGSYEETGRRLGLDRRTVKSKIDANLLDELRGRTGNVRSC